MLPLAPEDESGLARKKDWRKTKAERSPPEEKAWVVGGGERKGYSLMNWQRLQRGGKDKETGMSRGAKPERTLSCSHLWDH